MWKIFKYLIILAALLAVGIAILVSAILFSKQRIENVARGRVFNDLNSIPTRKVALVLGCAKILPGGFRNDYFEYRIQAATELYHAGKVHYILVSGDNSRKEYDEATAMRDDLIALGVPTDRIVCDYAGFSTLDSVVRANKVFLENQMTVVSQPFHVKRAIFIGSAKGIDLIGYSARDVVGTYGLSTQLREYLARFKTVLDVSILGREPVFYGDTIEIGQPSSKVLSLDIRS